MAWAVVTAAGIADCGRHPAARAAAVAYPPAVAGTVLVTANHFLLDVAAGSALGAAALAAARRQPSSAGPARSSRTSAS
jgi:hypothetical protein